MEEFCKELGQEKGQNKWGLYEKEEEKPVKPLNESYRNKTGLQV